MQSIIKTINSSVGTRSNYPSEMPVHLGLPTLFLTEQEGKMIIYQIQNKINNKSYIGYSTKFNSDEEFQNSDYWGSGIAIKKAIEKYGAENFERKILLKDILDFEQLKQCEVLCIKKKKSYWTDGGYNLTYGGDGLINPTEETKKKISDKLKGRYIGKEHPSYGRKMPKEELFHNKQRAINQHKNNSELAKNTSESAKKWWSGLSLEEKLKRKENQSQKMKGRYNDENNPRAKNVLLVSPNGEAHRITGYKKFCKENNLSYSAISGVLRNKQKQHKGWRGIYLNEDVEF